MQQAILHHPVSPTALSAAAAASSDADLRLLVKLFWRRKPLLVVCAGLGFCAMFVALMFMPPRFTARTSILIDTAMPTSWPAEFETLAGGMKYDTAVLMSEIEILKSRNLAQRVFNRLGLADDLGGSVAAAPPPRAPHVRPAPREQGFKTLSVNPQGLSTDSAAKDPRYDGMVSQFLEHLSVRNVPGSFVIQLEYTAHDPALAATIANTIAQLYIDQDMQDRQHASRRIREWLDSRLAALRDQVLRTQQEVQQFKWRHGLMEGSRGGLVSAEQLSALNAELVQAKAERAEASARLSQIRALRKGAGLEHAPAALRSDVIEKLRLQALGLQTAISELSMRYGEKHPAMIKARTELRDTEHRLARELEKITAEIASEYQASSARVAALQEGLTEAGTGQFQDQEALVQLAALEREAETSRLVFNSFLETYKRGDDQELLYQPQARIISPAAAPQEPVYPRRGMMLTLATLIGLFAGLAMVIVLEKFDNSFKSPGQIEQALGYPCFALIPRVGRTNVRGGRAELARYILSHPSSNIAEAVRTLRMVLNLRAKNQAGEKPRVITITSSFPNEGKTTLSSWLARSAAKSGERVIVIDGDLRRPAMHRAMGQKGEETLVDYLTGQMDLERVVKKDPDSGAHVIFGRAVPHTALDLLGAARMKNLIESLRLVYDLVIIDSPACLAVSDARILASLSDQVLYAVSWDETPREIVYSGVKQFTDFNYQPLAFVLTNVDVKRHVSYGYGEAAYYTRTY